MRSSGKGCPEIVTAQRALPLEQGAPRRNVPLGPDGFQTWGLRMLEGMSPEQRIQAFLVLVAGVLVMLASVLASVGPLQAGLLSNDWTAYVSTEDSYGPGLHFVGLGKSFITFPTNQVELCSTLSNVVPSPIPVVGVFWLSKPSLFVPRALSQVTVMFTDQPAKGAHADSGPISTRTGDDHGELDSGGQSITLCLSLQYRLPTGPDLGKIYAAFGPGYHDRFLLITRNTISNVAQEFGPTDFWQRRTAVADAMLEAVQAALAVQGKVTGRGARRRPVCVCVGEGGLT